MPAETMILAIAAALLVGAGASWWAATRSLKRKFDARMHHAVGVMRKQHDAVIDKMNSAHEFAKKELERLRSAPPRPMSSTEQRSALARLEEQLAAAYAELDRLRLEVKGPAPTGRGSRSPSQVAGAEAAKRSPTPSKQDLTNGFAVTEVFES